MNHYIFSVACFDFSHGDIAYHQATLDNLKQAMKSTNKLCSVCTMLLNYSTDSIFLFNCFVSQNFKIILITSYKYMLMAAGDAGYSGSRIAGGEQE
jgi:Pyruvate kinase, barrel domain